jgi:tetratricopeptide (TPR) repeat protein
MQRAHLFLLIVPTLLAGCAGHPSGRTLADLHHVEPDLAEVQISDGLEAAMQGYRRFLEEAPESALTPEAMRRLADLKLEKEYGILGGPDRGALPAPEASRSTSKAGGGAGTIARLPSTGSGESEQAFEQRAAGDTPLAGAIPPSPPLPGGEVADGRGPREAIELYDRILTSYPDYEHNDRVLYQKARAYDELGRPAEAIAVIEQLIEAYPHSRHIDEVQFRRAEYFFTRRRYLDAEEAYQAITVRGPVSDFYELALYKLGWALYKQELYSEAIDQYVALLDHEVATGYDFEQSEDEDAERRIADTFRVVSLSFSSIGGPEVIASYFAEHGERAFEDRIYQNLGEFYLEKLRYQDAASAYEAFVELHPMHRLAPHFGLRVVEIYEAGGFPKLVLSSKKEFAARYGIDSPYWQLHAIEDAPEVVESLKGTLRDLARHYHAAYQDPEQQDARVANFRESERWYRAYLASFSQDETAPSIHHQLADLLLENESFGQAALEYEKTAYGYPPHEQAAEAGYAAIYAHRKEQEHAAPGEPHDAARQAAVESTLRFVDAFPGHEHAPVVLGAAVDDLYQMGQLGKAIETGRRLIDSYPQADPAILRSAWLAVAHAAFDLADYPQAEEAYTVALERTAADDDSRQAVVDNLAASIYEQGEQARAAGNHREAADHFLRIAEVAPTSAIRASAEYDAGAALITLEDWDAAVRVFEDFQQAYPEHELYGEATKQLAMVYRKRGDLALAAGEYERIAVEAEEEELRREALLVAAELYEEAGVLDRALEAYRRYVDLYPEPLELVAETRFKIAALHEAMGDVEGRKLELRRIVELDRAAGAARTDRIRTLAARSDLALTEEVFERFAEVKLALPFERSLKEKQRRMSEALSAFGQLVDYEVGDVTAAATFYMAEIYRDFGQSLLASERPTNLSEAEMSDYELALEEEAFPFEEKAIEVHRKNLELMGVGVYNRWIEKSLAKLGDLMPGRYAKFEESIGLATSIDQYAYVAPSPAPTAPVVADEESGVAEGRAVAAEAATEPPRVEPAGAASPEEAGAEPVPAAPADVAPVEGIEPVPPAEPDGRETPTPSKSAPETSADYSMAAR